MNAQTTLEARHARIEQEDLDRVLKSVGGARAVEDVYPLSPLQAGILFHCLYEPHQSSYVGTVSWRVEDGFDDSALELAWRAVVARHSILRTAFVGHDLPTPLQVVMRKVVPSISRYDWSDLPAPEQSARLGNLQEAECRRGFDLSKPCLMRVAVVKLGERLHQVIWTHHHLILDGWSLPVLFREIHICYAAFQAGSQPGLPPARPYRDYISWLQRRDRSKLEAYWARKLTGFEAAPPLGDALSGAGGESSSSAKFDRQLSLPMQVLETFARHHGLTLSVIVQSVWALLLGRYCNTQDVIFGCTLSGRIPDLPDIDHRVGLFINSLPLRVRWKTGTAVSAWLRKMQQNQSELLEYQHSSLQEILGWARIPAGAPLFESTLAFENYPVEPPPGSLGETALRVTRVDHSERPHYPLNLLFTAREALSLTVLYDTRRFEPSSIERLSRHFEVLLRGVLADPQRPIGQLPLLAGAEREQLLVAWNQTRHEHTQEKCLHQLFAEQAERTPGAVALVCAEAQLTYQELDRRSNQLANHLRGLGVGAEMIVGLCMERSVEMVVGLLGIVKAGGAYLPLDPEHPAERLQYMLSDAKVPWVLTHSSIMDRVSGQGAQVICVDQDWPQIDSASHDVPLNQSGPDDLVYVIYTSGSTGAPKGTLIHHRGLTNYLLYAAACYRVNEDTHALVVTPLSFDATVTSLLTPLVCGGRVMLADPADRELRTLWGGSAAGNYSLVKLTPAHLSLLPGCEASDGAYPADITFVVGGEALSSAQVIACREAFPRARVINEYGPTETVVGCAVFDAGDGVGHGCNIPIGRPIWNTQLYVLDEEQEPVPVGVAGELYIGGVGLARGYLNRAGLTAQRFVPSPFGEGERLYRTGDRVRYREDGNLEFLGRLDHQVKIRGYRIELGEIEAVLQRHGSVQQAVVVAREDVPGSRNLVGYVVGKGSEVPQAQVLQKYLQESLPQYMVPAVIVELEQIPLTSNGKIDRKALPAPDQVQRAVEYVGARTPVEEALVRIWSEVLRVPRVGVHDNFFELGGDSIQSIRIAARAKQMGIELAVREVFDQPTIAQLALVASRSGNAVMAEQGIVTGEIPLMPAQLRWFEMYPGQPQNYIVPIFLQCRKEISAVLLQTALDHMLAHHDALRVRLKQLDDGWGQENLDETCRVTLQCHDLSGLSEPDQSEAIERLVRDTYGTIALTGPLLSASLMLLGNGRSPRLLIAIHHFVFDRVSQSIFMDDLHTLYEQLERGSPLQLPPKTTSFRTWAARLLEFSRSAQLRQEQEYWEMLPWEFACLPKDEPGGRNTIISTARVSVSLDQTHTARLRARISRNEITSMRDALLAAVVFAVTRWSANRIAFVSVAAHGRDSVFPDVDISRTIGWFARAILVSIQAPSTPDESQWLHAVTRAFKNVPNTGLGYAILKFLCRAPALIGRQEPELHFNDLGDIGDLQGGSLFETTSLPCHPPVPGELRGAVLSVETCVATGRVVMNWDYSAELHRVETIEALARHALDWLRALAEAHV